VAIDSTAELLFNISANSDDATENVARFRALMGQDLDGMASQFSDWSDEVIGKIDSVQAAMTAGLAVIAAGVVAVGAAVGESTREYQKYAEEIHKAAVLTGMHTEDLSALHSMAAKAGVDYGTLTKGLGLFASNIIKASQGSKQQLDAFAALGISQKDVIAGQKDELPLLMKVMDGFHNLKSEVQQAAIQRDLFGRGGQLLAEVLRGGSEAFREAAEECKRYGLSLSTENVDAAHKFTVAQRDMREQLEGVGTSIGKTVMPFLPKFAALLIATAKASYHLFQSFEDPLHAKGFDLLTQYRAAIKGINEEVAKSHREGVLNLIGGAGTTGAIKEAKTEFQGLVNLVESMKEKIASEGTGWDKLTEEVAHYHVEIDKATSELAKLQKAGSITPESLHASQEALAQIPALLAKVVGETTLKLTAADQEAWLKTLAKAAEAENAETAIVRKAGEDRLEVTREINDKLSTAGEQGYAQQRAQLQRQMADWAASLAKKAELTAEDWDAIDKITAEGLAKIDHTETAAWQDQIRKLQEHLDQATAANATAQQKLNLEYQKELQQYSQVEEQKVLKTAQTEAQVVQIMQMYGQIRTQITQKYQDDLQKLLDSQGFQGVFGSYFANLIKGNQNMLRQWAQSSNQSIMMVQMSLEALKEQAQKTFQTFSQGLGQTITQAFVAGKSVSQAMEQMLASTLESFAGQAITAAIMATGWGFYWLMLQNYSAAGQAFTSAAIFATVGAASAVAAKMMTPSSASGAGSGSGAGSAAGTGSGQGNAAAAGAGASSQQVPNIYVTVQGHVIGPSGAAQLADILNQAVYGNSVQLYASHNPVGIPL
jgi:hypothetical protein